MVLFGQDGVSVHPQTIATEPVQDITHLTAFCNMILSEIITMDDLFEKPSFNTRKRWHYTA